MVTKIDIRATLRAMEVGDEVVMPEALVGAIRCATSRERQVGRTYKVTELKRGIRVRRYE